MADVFEASDWQTYSIDYKKPLQEVESIEAETEVVDGAIGALIEAGILPHGEYDGEKVLALRKAIRERFDIPWTAITPRMQRLLFAINSIAKPRVMVAVGIFCGVTFSSNAGTAIGPGSVYRADRLVGIEIEPEEADRARRNVKLIDPKGKAEILAEDGLPWLERFDEAIDLLYLDADGKGKGKGIYLDMTRAARHTFHPGSIVLAHNSVNSAQRLGEYLNYVRDPENFRASVNMVIDGEGLEVSMI
jgi:predicted O-methyltransferase YrrM